MNTKLTIKNGKIVDYYDRYFDSVSDNAYEGNGWCVAVTDNTVHAIAEREYSTGIHRCEVTIKNNFMFTVFSIDGRVWKEAKKRCTYDGNGILGLSGDNIDVRYAYWRSELFSNFLKKHDIASVERINGEYLEMPCPLLLYSKVWSDTDDNNIEVVGAGSGGRARFLHATHVIIKKENPSGCGYTRILYTKAKDIMSLGEELDNLHLVSIPYTSCMIYDNNFDCTYCRKNETCTYIFKR